MEKDQIKMIEEATKEVVMIVIEKLQEENEEEFRLRRFTELLNNLPLESLGKLWFKVVFIICRFGKN